MIKFSIMFSNGILIASWEFYSYVLFVFLMLVIGDLLVWPIYQVVQSEKLIFDTTFGSSEMIYGIFRPFDKIRKWWIVHLFTNKSVEKSRIYLLLENCLKSQAVFLQLLLNKR